MAINLIFLRRGVAVDLGSEGVELDELRPLTHQGVKGVRRAVKAFSVMGLKIKRIIASPTLRAKQTAQTAVEILHATPSIIEVSEDLAPGKSGRAFIERLAVDASNDECILVVGHEPNLSAMASMLLSGRQGMRISIHTGGALLLRIETLSWGMCASLEWLMDTDQLAEINK